METTQAADEESGQEDSAVYQIAQVNKSLADKSPRAMFTHNDHNSQLTGIQ